MKSFKGNLFLATFQVAKQNKTYEFIYMVSSARHKINGKKYFPSKKQTPLQMYLKSTMYTQKKKNLKSHFQKDTFLMDKSIQMVSIRLYNKERRQKKSTENVCVLWLVTGGIDHLSKKNCDKNVIIDDCIMGLVVHLN